MGHWVVGRGNGSITALSADLASKSTLPTGARTVLDITSDGKKIAVVNGTNKVMRLGLQNGQLETDDEASPFVFGSEPLVALQFVGEDLWAIDNTGSAIVWRGQDPAEPRRVENICPEVRAKRFEPALLPNHRRVVGLFSQRDQLLVADQSGTVRFLRDTNQEPEPLFKNLRTKVGKNPKVQLAGDGKGDLWALDDVGTLTVFDSAGNRIADAKAHPQVKRRLPEASKYAPYTGICTLPNGRVVTVGDETKAKEWELAEGEIRLVREFPAEAKVISIACSPEKQLLAAVDEKARLNVWDLKTGRRTRVASIPTDGRPRQRPFTGRLAFNCDGSLLAVFGDGQDSRVLITSDWSEVQTALEAAGLGGVSVAWSPTDRRIVARTDGRDTYSRDISSRETQLREPATIALATGADAILGLRRSGELIICSPNTGRSLATMDTGSTDAISISADSKNRVAVGFADGHIKVLPVDRFEPKKLEVSVSTVLEEPNLYWVGSPRIKQASDGSMVTAITAGTGELERTGKLWFSRFDGRNWLTEEVYGSRPVMKGSISLDTNPPVIAFRNNYGDAYQGDLLLARLDRDSWNIEVVDRQKNTGVVTVLHKDDDHLDILHFDANFRDLLVSSEGNATEQGWPSRFLMTKHTPGRRGASKDGVTWLFSRSFRYSRDTVSKICRWDGSSFRSFPVPPSYWHRGLPVRFLNGTPVTGLEPNDTERGHRAIAVFRDEEWNQLAEIPNVPTEHDYPHTFAVTKGGKFVFAHSIDHRVIIQVLEEGAWAQFELDVDLGDKRVAVTDINISDSGEAIVLVRPATYQENSWLKSLSFQLP